MTAPTAVAASDPEPNELAQRLAVAPTARGLSQGELARRSGVGQSRISRIESGEKAQPAFADVVALAHALELTLETLTERDSQALLAALADPAAVPFLTWGAGKTSATTEIDT